MNWFLYYAFQDIMDNSDDIGSGIGALVMIILGLFLANRVLTFIEFALTPFLALFLVLLVAATLLIPEIQKKGWPDHQFKALVIGNRAVCAIVGYILVTGYDLSVAHAVSNLIPHSENLLEALFLFSVGIFSIPVDLILIPLFATYWVQRLVWRQFFDYNPAVR